MYISAKTLDDLLRIVLTKLLASNSHIEPDRGACTELCGVMLKLYNPRARLSRTERKGTVFSCLGDFLWHMAGSNQLNFITYYIEKYFDYSDDGQTVFGAYGPRLLGMRGINQVTAIIELMRRRPDSRRAVIQLFDAADIVGDHKDVPCTCTLQFLARRGRLHLVAHMRSNDAFMGLPHDVFAFTMLQELIARTLGMEMGTYTHMVASLHLYDWDVGKTRLFLDEGWQSTVAAMPPMPLGDPWPSLQKVLAAEEELRLTGRINVRGLGLDPYWEDLVRLLQIHSHAKRKRRGQIAGIQKRMVFRAIYDPYVNKRKHRTKKESRETPSLQRLLGLDPQQPAKPR